jgi:endonuclease/exonuclease/phosphatase family metal-dependent hydrolase
MVLRCLVLLFVLISAGAPTPAGSATAAPPGRPAVDGTFGDWDVVTDVWTDPKDDGDAADAVDFGELRVFSDAERVTFLVDLGREMNLQSGNEVALLVDTDADTSTGRPREGLGADFGWMFGRREGRAWSDGDAWRVSRSDIGFLQAPTVSSSVFEISFLRRSLSGHDVLMGDHIALVMIDPGGDRLPDEGVISLRLSDEPPPATPPMALERDDPDAIRVLTWNVLFDGLFERPAPFIRVLRALDPDVICFQEIWAHTARQAADYVSLALPQTEWHGMNTEEGHVISRYPFLRTRAVDEAGNYWALVDLPDDRYAVDLSVLCAHPPCCDKEVERQEQLDGIAAWTRDTMTPGPPAFADGAPAELDLAWGTPIVIAGDMNLVGGADQVLTLREGRIANGTRYGASFSPDWDDTPLSDSWARRVGGTSVATWRDAGSSFAPGKLDYIFYSDSALRLEKAFILATEELDADLLSRYGLRAEDTLEASDHLPVVADFTPIAAPSRTGSVE